MALGIDDTKGGTKVSGKGRVTGDAKKAIGETLDAHAADLTVSAEKEKKDKRKRGEDNSGTDPKKKKEKTPEQQEIKDLQKDVKSFPGL